jgi:hypothetical protein
MYNHNSFFMRYFTLLCFLFFSLACFAQVGVNNATPEQALDVNGKIKLTDDSTAPSAGTLRYNAGEDDFEGYNGSEWKSLTTSGAGPGSPVPMFGSTNAVSRGDNGDIVLKSWDGSVGSFTTVPNGKYFIVTAVMYKDNNLDIVDRNVVAEMYSMAPGGVFLANIRFQGLESILRPIIGDLDNPLLVIRPGGTVRLYHYNGSEEPTIDVDIRGFLVDDLDY